jgi:sugar lactone lactonase YvrE
MRALETIAAGNTLGECVLWDDRTGAVWWTDIERYTLYRLDWQSRTLRSFATPARLTAFGLTDADGILIAAFEDGFSLYEPASGRITPRLVPEGLLHGQRLNDGRVDRTGRFWTAAMVEWPHESSNARLYRLDADGVSAQLDGIAIGNGLCWSPDGRLGYVADSRAGTLWQFDYDGAKGVLSHRREFARSAQGACPDGATVDSEGFVWCAQWGGSAVVRYTPGGQIDRVLEVPVAQPTSIAFGGPDLELMFVTSAAHALRAPQTGAGDLFVYNAPVRGLKESRFRIDAWPKGAGPLR